MNYITKEKLLSYLKLKKEIALFLGIGHYFESKTFEWIKLEFKSDRVKCTKIHSFDEGNYVFNDVKSFSTVNDLEKESDSNEQSVEGTLEHCLSWINKYDHADTNKFILIEDLNEIYAHLVENGQLGN